MIYAGSGVLAVAVARDLVFAVLFVVSLLCFAASRATVRRIARRAGEARAKNEQLAELYERDSPARKIRIGNPASGSPPSAVTSHVSCM